jgi:hypothetical protein
MIQEDGTFTATRICDECERGFNLFDANDANEWFYGHDCESVVTV